MVEPVAVRSSLRHIMDSIFPLPMGAAKADSTSAGSTANCLLYFLYQHPFLWSSSPALPGITRLMRVWVHNTPLFKYPAYRLAPLYSFWASKATISLARPCWLFCLYCHELGLEHLFTSRSLRFKYAAASLTVILPSTTSCIKKALASFVLKKTSSLSLMVTFSQSRFMVIISLSDHVCA